jgi:hypothetical protein
VDARGGGSPVDGSIPGREGAVTNRNSKISIAASSPRRLDGSPSPSPTRSRRNREAVSPSELGDSVSPSPGVSTRAGRMPGARRQESDVATIMKGGAASFQETGGGALARGSVGGVATSGNALDRLALGSQAGSEGATSGGSGDGIRALATRAVAKHIH